MFSFATSLALLVLVIGNARAETHTVSFTNKCGFGTPTLIQGPNVLSTGGKLLSPPRAPNSFDAGAYTSNGPLISAIAYLQTGACGFNGEGCTLLETTLTNGFSSTDLSLIPPHAFSVTTGFGYYNGCDGAGADCQEANCPEAFESSDQTWKQVGCPAANVDLAITFCD
ncbi:Glycopeptide [Mycena sanguinolenta]|uniref:Glycopeptide n=1 Tax=Mycena sanguinolenta TaxID=230812 RepID=A0A8H6ZGE1_9AGAR|nr:Glycopeptide [Mycena sanguinolenta]